MLTWKNMQKKVVTGTCSATPGTRTSHAHGLPFTPTEDSVFLKQDGVDGDVDDAGVAVLVKCDGTNIVVKSNKASLNFRAVIFFDPRSAGSIVRSPA